MHFDGFRTSHEIQKIGIIDYEDLKHLLDNDALRSIQETRSEAAKTP